LNPLAGFQPLPYFESVERDFAMSTFDDLQKRALDLLLMCGDPEVDSPKKLEGIARLLLDLTTATASLYDFSLRRK